MTNRKAKKVSGASVPRSRKPRRLGRWLVMFLLIGAGAYGFSQVDLSRFGNTFQQAAHQPVKSISIHGNFTFVAKAEVQNIIEEILAGDFIDIDIRQIKSRIEEHPWVQQANIKRTWPDGLDVHVDEQIPIARWGNAAFINRYGDLIQVDDTRQLTQLPLLSADEKFDTDFVRRYIEIVALLNTFDLKVKTYETEKSGVVKIGLVSGTELIVPADNVFEALSQFGRVYENKLSSVANELARVDMRYRSGMALAWRTKI